MKMMKSLDRFWPMDRRLVVAVGLAVLAIGPAKAQPDPSRAAAEATVERIVAAVQGKVADLDAPFRLVVRLRALPEHLGDVLDSYATQRAVASENRGSLVYQVSQVAGDPTALVLYEDWADLRAFVAHETSEATIAHFARVAPWLEDERSLTIAIPANSAK